MYVMYTYQIISGHAWELVEDIDGSFHACMKLHNAWRSVEQHQMDCINTCGRLTKQTTVTTNSVRLWVFVGGGEGGGYVLAGSTYLYYLVLPGSCRGSTLWTDMNQFPLLHHLQ